MEFLTAENRLARFLKTEGFQQLRESLNQLLDNPVWWYALGVEDAVRILESHNKTECGLLHDDPQVRGLWLDATYAAMAQAGSDRTAVMAESPPERTQIVVPVLCGEAVVGYVGLAHLPNREQQRLYPFLPILTLHLCQIAERERATEDLQAIQRLWKEVVSTLDSEVLLKKILEEILSVLDSHEGVVLLVDQEHRLVKSTMAGFDSSESAQKDFHIPSTPYENKVFSWPHAAQMLSEGDPLRQWYLTLFENARPGMGVWGVPLALSGRLLGLVLCTGKEGTALMAQLDTTLETLALGSSVAIRNALDFEQLHQKAVALGTVHSVYRLVSTTRIVGDPLDKTAILSRMGKLILQVLKVRKCSIMLLDEQGVLQPCVKYGLEDGEVGSLPLELGVAIPGRAAQDANSLMLENPLLDQRFENDPASFYPSLSYLSVPMFEAEVIGVMTVSERSGYPNRFSEGDREVLHTMAEQAVIALLNIDTYEKQERIAIKTMGVFNNLFETGDPDHQGRAHRLSSLLLNFARFLKIDSQTCQFLQMAAFIHGIALLKIPRKSPAGGPAGNHLYRHIEVAVRMARRLEMTDQVVSILRDHHENFDGTGGPRGLKGEEIPLGARMLTLADTYLKDVENSHLNPEEAAQQALDHLKELAGKRFDPNLVESFGKYISTTQASATSQETTTGA